MQFKAQSESKYAAYIEMYCVECDVYMPGCGRYTCFSRTDHDNCTYKCYFDLIQYKNVPSFDDKIKYLWDIDRGLLRKSNYQLTSPVLHIHNNHGDIRREKERHYFLEVNKYSITLRWAHRDRHLLDRIGYIYWIEVEFDAMTTKWTGHEFAYNYPWLYMHPSSSMQYFNEWLKRFISTIKCIKLQFQHIVD